ncbi:unnamed protein product [Lactuca virosa]|uniref:Uncharacterized protein n=1 Tax=Lactuca virosa TaxID=75947 RepID=A0AAU9MQI0_9ASTR|nr:unnamed protein product [Lactuca virosa]
MASTFDHDRSKSLVTGFFLFSFFISPPSCIHGTSTFIFFTVSITSPTSSRKEPPIFTLSSPSHVLQPPSMSEFFNDSQPMIPPPTKPKFRMLTATIQKYVVVDEKAIIDSSVPNFPSDSETDSVEVALIAKKIQKSRRKKRKFALLEWNWDGVIEICSDDYLGEDVPIIQPKKKLRVVIQNRNRPTKVIDESDFDDDLLYKFPLICFSKG